MMLSRAVGPVSDAGIRRRLIDAEQSAQLEDHRRHAVTGYVERLGAHLGHPLAAAVVSDAVEGGRRLQDRLEFATHHCCPLTDVWGVAAVGGRQEIFQRFDVAAVVDAFPHVFQGRGRKQPVGRWERIV